MAEVKVGVIGVGVLGRHHARLYKECSNARLIATHIQCKSRICRINIYGGLFKDIPRINAFINHMPGDAVGFFFIKNGPGGCMHPRVAR